TPGRKARPRDICVLGSSWVMGVGCEYEESFCGLLEERYGLDTACLGGGNFNILQMVRYARRMLPFYRPRVLVVSYFAGYTTRAFRREAFSVRRVGERPVYVRRHRGGYRLLDLGVTPGAWYMQRLHTLMQRLARPHDFSLADVRTHLALSVHLWGLRKLKSLWRHVDVLRHGRFHSVPDKEAVASEELRRMVLADVARDLRELGREHGCHVLVYHHFPYRFTDETTLARARRDGELLEEYFAGDPQMHYAGFDCEQAAYDRYIAEHGLEPGNYYEQFKLPDDAHPNKAANEMIAACIHAALDRAGLLPPRS
ncbi:MAG: hypothetical protein AB7D57_09705, partial [Desulfovibrionaceae bacterium]